MFYMEEWTKITLQEFPTLLDITESPSKAEITKY